MMDMILEIERKFEEFCGLFEREWWIDDENIEI